VASDIDFVEIKMSADGGDTFNGLVQAPPDTLEHLVTDVDPGTYSFIGVVQDIDGLRSDPVTITTDAGEIPPVPGDAPPMPLPTFMVVVE
jgi:hypothetical protein